ncbi:MAG: hypothetical protein Q7U28_19995 [Aquabacterium sp.]|nr:hypothetical protein [Aquabacterium sp.]
MTCNGDTRLEGVWGDEFIQGIMRMVNGLTHARGRQAFDNPEDCKKQSLHMKPLTIPHAPHPVHEHDAAHWQDLLSQVGRELAGPLTASLERVATLTTTGHIDRQGLKALRSEIDRARQAGMWCQQIARLAFGAIRQSHETVSLNRTVLSVFAHRTHELKDRGIEVTHVLQTMDIHLDPSMLFALLNALVDWCLDCAIGPVNVRIADQNGSDHAHLSCAFVHNPAAYSRLDTVSWHLLAETASALGLALGRRLEGRFVHLDMVFPSSTQITQPTVETAATAEP